MSRRFAPRGLAAAPPWCLAVVLAACLAAARGEQTKQGDDWPRYGHDGGLTGRSSLRGEIDSPHAVWSASVAGATFVLELEPSPDESRLELRAEEARPGAGTGRLDREAWGLAPVRLDIDGSGALRPAVETYHERWADILSGVRGLERIAWSHVWTTAKIVRLELFAHDQGADKPRRVWQNDPPEGDIFSPLDIASDIDKDGTMEILVAAHYRVMVFEGTTGRKETELRYHSSRPYGWFGLADVDADGDDELVTIGDFQSHLDVLEYDRTKPEAERLAVKWRRDIESDISQRTKWPQVGPRPVVDVTGDGRLELLVNLYNTEGDGQWHLHVIDASSGAVLADLPRRVTQGSADLDGDGKEEVFACATHGVVVPRFSRLELLGADRGGLAVRHAFEDAQWACADLQRLGARWSTTATDGMRQALVTPATASADRPAWLVWSRPELALAAWELDAAGSPRSPWRLRCRGDIAEPRALAIAGGPRVLVELTVPAGGRAELAGDGVSARVVESRSDGGPPAPPIAVRLEPGRPAAVVVEGAGGRIAAIDAPSSGERGVVRWRASGRGMTNGSRLAGLAAADLDGDGRREVIAGDEAASGVAEVVAYDASGAALWRSPVAGVPGPAPGWNRGGLTYFWPGRFRDVGRDDVFVSIRRGFMHSDSGLLLDGATGREVWRRDAADQPGVFHWGYAGSILAAADVTGDGRDELVNLYPVCFWVADGKDGAFLAARELASRKLVPAWAAYGEPLVADVTGDGRREVVLDSGYLLALLDASGAPLWHGPPRADYPSGKPEDNIGQTTETRHALADFDGDGRPELASAGYADGLRAIDPGDGKTLWSLAAPAPAGEKVCAADIDGRTGDEVLYPAGDTLVAVTGDRSAGRILWTWKGSARLGLPAIADVDGDGKAEVVVRDAQGTIHCLDRAPRGAPGGSPPR